MLFQIVDVITLFYLRLIMDSDLKYEYSTNRYYYVSDGVRIYYDTDTDIYYFIKDGTTWCYDDKKNTFVNEFYQTNEIFQNDNHSLFINIKSLEDSYNKLNKYIFEHKTQDNINEYNQKYDKMEFIDGETEENLQTRYIHALQTNINILTRLK